MSLLIAIIVITVLGTAVNLITRTPDQKKTKLTGWGIWFAALEGLAFGAVAAVLGALYAFLTGHMPPAWMLLIALYLAQMFWQLYRHAQRQRERRALQALMEQPAFGEDKQ